MLPLASTQNKEAIRRRWDKPIIAKFSRSIKKPLDYFGLPGPDIRDFHDWGKYLGFKTGIEVVTKRGKVVEEQLRKVNALETNVILDGFSENWQLRRGFLENIILDGVDIDGNAPALLATEGTKNPRMTYDLHNWDFQGGLGYKSKGEAKRIQALKRLIELQRAHPFLLLLTLNVRHTLGTELSRYLTGIGNETYSRKHQRILKWYSERKAIDSTEHYRTKATVPLFIRQIAHINSFDCYCYPPVYYEGWKEHLLHFVFTLTPQGTTLPAFSKQQLGQVVEMPLVEVHSGKFVLASFQHPGCRKQDGLDVLRQLGIQSK